MNILAIGPHPDDIEIGCAATLLKYARVGHNISLLVITSGAIGGDPQVRIAEQTQSAKTMGAKNLIWGNLEDTELAENKELIGKIENAIQNTTPDLVFIPYVDDIHQDHRAVSYSAITATRYIKEVLFYEVPTSQNFSPDIFIDIADTIEDKLRLLRIHASQVNKTRVENLTIIESAQSCATFRGFQGRVKYAEGFKALRILRDIR
jgi:LmbE family N-acetylglucosaminyl deacetylase